MHRLIIREAVEADDVALGELLVRAFKAEYARMVPEVVISSERVADLTNQAEKRALSTVLVAEADGKRVGTVALYGADAPGSEAWIAGAADLRLLAVDVAYQGRGLSRTLLDRAEAKAVSWGVPAICLHVRRGAHRVASLYEARGYVREPAGDLDHLPRVFLEAYALRLLRESS